MTRKRFHGLKKVKVRATWNKINLYNLSRLKSPSILGTYFQQKWLAKSVSRAYHGEHIREKQWQRMFKPRMQAVVAMDHKYLAENDGSEFAAGRGSGKDEVVDLKRIRFGRNQIPFMQMTYAPIERRLDMAVWRALFASSARQARQFCVHGMVKVNGQKMPYPGYLLNPGDMFQVEPDSVLFATGAPKTIEQIKAARIQRTWNRRISKNLRMGVAKAPRRTAMKVTQPLPESEETQVKPAPARVSQNIADIRRQRGLDFRDLNFKLAEVLEVRQRTLGVKRKQQMRELSKDIKSARSRLNSKTEEELDAQLKDFHTRFTLLTKKPSKEDKKQAEEKGENVWARKLNEMEEEKLQQAIQRARENPIDETKPYATPWRPRPYMSAFAFVPRYLEVNHNICSAVYLRHPVARPGLAEVPSPFHYETQQLAFNWYLRRR